MANRIICIGRQFGSGGHEIAVKTADGTVWFSNPQNRLDLNASSLGRYSSPLLVTAIDSAETSKQMNAFDDSVK